MHVHVHVYVHVHVRNRVQVNESMDEVSDESCRIHCLACWDNFIEDDCISPGCTWDIGGFCGI